MEIGLNTSFETINVKLTDLSPKSDVYKIPEKTIIFPIVFFAIPPENAH